MRTRHHITIDICATTVALLALVATIMVQTPIEKRDGASGRQTDRAAAPDDGGFGTHDGRRCPLCSRGVHSGECQFKPYS